MNDREYGWQGFNGSRNEWAWNALEYYELQGAKDYDDVEREIMCRELLKTKTNYDKLKAKLEKASGAIPYVPIDEYMPELRGQIDNLITNCDPEDLPRMIMTVVRQAIEATK